MEPGPSKLEKIKKLQEEGYEIKILSEDSLFEIIKEDC